MQFNLRDYLKPGGNRPYEALPLDLQRAFDAGNEVYLYAVAGHFMLAGHPNMSSDYCWSDGDLWYASPVDALNGKNGKRFDSCP